MSQKILTKPTALFFLAFLALDLFNCHPTPNHLASQVKDNAQLQENDRLNNVQERAELPQPKTVTAENSKSSDFQVRAEPINGEASLAGFSPANEISDKAISSQSLQNNKNLNDKATSSTSAQDGQRFSNQKRGENTNKEANRGAELGAESTDKSKSISTSRAQGVGEVGFNQANRDQESAKQIAQLKADV